MKELILDINVDFISPEDIDQETKIIGEIKNKLVEVFNAYPNLEHIDLIAEIDAPNTTTELDYVCTPENKMHVLERIYKNS